MIVRYESWGAWVKLESADLAGTTVALGRDDAKALGLDGGRAWTETVQKKPSSPLEVHLAVTGRCGHGCPGCYLDARPDGEVPPKSELEARFEELARAGVFTVALGGGEPLTRDDLPELAASARSFGLSPVLTTSGIGLSEDVARALRGFAQVNVSFDGETADYRAVRGFDGSRRALAAVTRLARAGVRVGVNIVLTQLTFDRLESTVRLAREAGAREAQLLRYKPAGRAASLDYLTRRLHPEQAARFASTLRALVREHAQEADPFGGFHVRIDCALVPFLSADPELRGDDLARFGVFGCEAGARLGALRVDGRVAPCSFGQPTELRADAFANGRVDDELAPWRTRPDRLGEPCNTCPLLETCRGGCGVVSSFLTSLRSSSDDGSARPAGPAQVPGPDPECPRVFAFRRSEKTRPLSAGEPSSP